jgi:hypothetical protein
LSSEATAATPPTIFSFFTREFAPMADSVIELLRICGAQVDPNLLALTSKKTDTITDTNSNKQHQEKNDTFQVSVVDDSKANGQMSNADMNNSDDQFSHLDSNKIVLKRALHVSDAEDSDDTN